MRRLPIPSTLRGRLALTALITTAVWVAALTATFNLVLTAWLRGHTDELLRTRADATAATVQIRADGSLNVHEPADDTVLDTGVWIYRGRTAVERAAAPTTVQQDVDRLAASATASAYENAAAGSPIRLYALPLRDQAGRQAGTVVVAVSIDTYQGTAELALAGSVGLGLLFLCCVYLVTRMVIGRALRPVAAMSAQAARWSGHDAERRFGASESSARRPAELAALAGNLDQLLDRIAAALRHERQLSAELSHELRTPLARVTAEIEWLQARPRDGDEQRAAHAAIEASAARMRTICETLLSDARTRAGEASGRCAVPPLVRGLTARDAQAHPSITVLTTGTETDLVVNVPAPVVERILTPLLDNARRYAARRVTVECARTRGGVEVTVADDGPGVPADVGDAVFEPGRRASPDDDHDGAGLGLPLARRLARASGGEITLRPGPGGARFVVVLPVG